ncbi:MAG: MT-A70 family methyltransferase [Cyanobacteria bacterium P01_F01_bin.3]
MTIVDVTETARPLTQVVHKDAELGARIEDFHQRSLATGAESLRAMMAAGDLLQTAFDEEGRRETCPRWEDWLARYAPNISDRTDSNYRRLAKRREDVEDFIDDLLDGGQSPSLRGAIAYLKDTDEQKAVEGMPPWDNFLKLLDQVGRLRQVGPRLLLEPKAWAERYVEGLPCAYGSRTELWQAWKINHEKWIEQVEKARQITEDEQRKSQNRTSTPSLDGDTIADGQTHAATEGGGATGQEQGNESASSYLDHAEQLISVGTRVICWEAEDGEIGKVTGFDDGLVLIQWENSGAGVQEPAELLVSSQHVADEDAPEPIDALGAFSEGDRVHPETAPAMLGTVRGIDLELAEVRVEWDETPGQIFPESPLSLAAIAPETVPVQYCSGREFKLFEDLPSRHYNLIYADPAWQYRDKAQSGKRGAEFKYDCLPLEALMQLPVVNIAADDCLLAMWWVAPMPMEALRLVEAWGFEFKTMKGFTWRKVTVNGKDHFGMGSYTRANSEDCLFAVKGKPERKSAAVRQLISAQVREHSRKPDEARDALVELMGDVPRIELFARQHALGWDVWGNEAPEQPDTFSNVVPF